MRYKDRPHTRGGECDQCCCKNPTPCRYTEGCKGFVHLTVADEVRMGDNDWEWIHNFRCDTCLYKDYMYEYQDYEIEFIDGN